MGLVGTSVAHHTTVLVGTLLSSFLRGCGGRLGETMMELCRHVDVELNAVRTLNRGKFALTLVCSIWDHIGLKFNPRGLGKVPHLPKVASP